MKFLRVNAGFIITIIMCGLCLTAIGIAIRVTNITLERKHQVILNESLEEKKPENSSDSTVNISKISDMELYFNGRKTHGVNSYLTDNKQCLVPIDEITRITGQELTFYNSDDIVEAAIGKTKFTLKLGKDFAQVGNREIKLPAAPVSARGHILVPVELIKSMDGFSIDTHISSNSVFVNYYPDFMDTINTSVKVVRLSKGVAEISDVFGKKVFWDRKGQYPSYERIEYSSNGSTCILKSGDKLYILKQGNGLTPYLTGISSSAGLSQEGRFLSWVDKDTKSTLLYDIGTKKTKNLGDIRKKLFPSTEGSSIFSDLNIIYDYKEGSNYKRISLTDSLHSRIFTWIQRNGKPVVAGNAIYSPDKSRVLYYKEKEGYYVANTDGTALTLLGPANEAVWIGSSKIFLKTQNTMTIYNCKTKSRTGTDSIWNMVGQTSKGDILFTKDTTLFVETNGIEHKISELPGKCVYAAAQTAQGPYIAVCQGTSEGIFYLSGATVVQMGSSRYLPNEEKGEELHTDYKNSISYSPDNRKFIVFQRENGFIALNMISGENLEQKKILISYPLNVPSETGSVKSTWLSNDRVLVYSSVSGWIIDFKGDVKVYKWTEDVHSTIEGIFP